MLFLMVVSIGILLILRINPLRQIRYFMNLETLVPPMTPLLNSIHLGYIQLLIQLSITRLHSMLITSPRDACINRRIRLQFILLMRISQFQILLAVVQKQYNYLIILWKPNQFQQRLSGIMLIIMFGQVLVSIQFGIITPLLFILILIQVYTLLL